MPLYPYVELPHVNQGRLTLTSGAAVSTADVTGAGTLYFTPHTGAHVALYSGQAWRLMKFSETSLALTLTSGKNYDVYAYDNAGALGLELSASPWFTDLVRVLAGAGTDLATQDGVLVKKSSAGVTDATRRYLGTIRASGTNTAEDSNARRFVWNWQNQQPRRLYAAEATDSWTYTTATYRQARASAANQVEVVCGQPAWLDLALKAWCGNTTVAHGGTSAIGEDSTTVPDAACDPATWASPVANFGGGMAASIRKYPVLGYHFYAWMEKGTGSGTTTWYGDNGDITGMNNGLRGWIFG